MGLSDLAGVAKRIDEGQRELNARLDRIISLLESILECGYDNTLPFPQKNGGTAGRPVALG